MVAFGKEYGWRDYLVDALRGQQFWKAALLIGFAWLYDRRHDRIMKKGILQ